MLIEEMSRRNQLYDVQHIFPLQSLKMVKNLIETLQKEETEQQINTKIDTLWGDSAYGDIIKMRAIIFPRDFVNAKNVCF